MRILQLLGALAILLSPLAARAAPAAEVGQLRPRLRPPRPRREAGPALRPQGPGGGAGVVQPRLPLRRRARTPRARSVDAAARAARQGVVWLAVNSGRARQAGARRRDQPGGPRRLEDGAPRSCSTSRAWSGGPTGHQHPAPVRRRRGRRGWPTRGRSTTRPTASAARRRAGRWWSTRPAAVEDVKAGRPVQRTPRPRPTAAA
ncbi:MAG: hypothetical protein M0C28_40805 [Candidatus Moduliflexus flocculans]|nr:hypothetical protein [Candidatus Moduliflexus flocculans]